MRLKQNLLEGLSTFMSVVKSHIKATQPFIKNNRIKKKNPENKNDGGSVMVNSCFAI